MKRILIGALLLLGLIPWLVAMPCLWLCTWAARIGHRIDPDLMYGNCWTYALPRFAQHGGYLMVRPAVGVKLFRWLSVPHVIWIKRLPADGVEMEMFEPRQRQAATWLPWRTIWYRGRITRAEKPGRHDAREL